MELPGDDIAALIRASGNTIYDTSGPEAGQWYPVHLLEQRLRLGLRGLDLDLAPRTRSKVVKSAVAGLLGYPTPVAFQKTKPRFPAQDLDVYVQKADNLQIWNEEIAPMRRYALIRVNSVGIVRDVRVLTGNEIALLDRTGTLTSKFQAKRRPGREGSHLVSTGDTSTFSLALAPDGHPPSEGLLGLNASDPPSRGRVLTVEELYRRLRLLEGTEFPDTGVVQDRARGAVFQRLASAAIGVGSYSDSGQFPDIVCQALEVKLQLSPTIDLGLISPDSTAIAEELGSGVRHCDVRYAIAYGIRVGANVRITDIVVTTGAEFFTEFQRFEGQVVNKKIQIPLPRALFEAE